MYQATIWPPGHRPYRLFVLFIRLIAFSIVIIALRIRLSVIYFVLLRDLIDILLVIIAVLILLAASFS